MASRLQIIFALAVLLFVLVGGLSTWWLIDQRQKREIMEISSDFQALREKKATLTEVWSVLRGRWEPEEIYIIDDRLVLSMEILKYRGYRQGQYQIVFSTATGEMIRVDHLSTH